MSGVQSPPCPPFFSESCWGLPRSEVSRATPSSPPTYPELAPFALRLRAVPSASSREPHHRGWSSLGIVVERLELRARLVQHPFLDDGVAAVDALRLVSHHGAFTGAVGKKEGLLTGVDGGTVFLDEIGDLTPRAQTMLLRSSRPGRGCPWAPRAACEWTCA